MGPSRRRDTQNVNIYALGEGSRCESLLFYGFIIHTFQYFCRLPQTRFTHTDVLEVEFHQQVRERNAVFTRCDSRRDRTRDLSRRLSRRVDTA